MMAVPSSPASSKSATRRPTVGDCVHEKYDLINQLGEGGFGAVFEVIDRRNNKHYAMKVELEIPLPDEPGLDTEGAALKRLHGYPHILTFVDEGRHGPHAYLVMQLAGTNLSDLRRKCKGKCFTNNTTMRLAYQSLESIEVVHISGLLHRDIKPANFAIGLDEEKRTIFILDFGLVRKYKIRGKVRPPRPAAGFRGSVRYASINCHNHVDLGRVDDLWSWMYSLIEMKKGRLPWSSETGTKKTGVMKMKTTRDELMRDMEPEYHVIYKHLETLKYENEPAYLMYKEEFAKMKKRKGYQESAPFDWEEGGSDFVHSIYTSPDDKEKAVEKAIVEEKSKKDDET